MLLLFITGNGQNINPFDYRIQKKAIAKFGMVVSAHPLASQVGLSILQKGGNAVDAAIATQLALAVVYPEAGNIGGGGFMVAHLKSGKNIALDFREKAPSKAFEKMYLDTEGKPLKDLSKDGHLAVGVPGTISGIFASMIYANLPFTELVQPAITLAENGFAITDMQANSFNTYQQELNKFNRVPPAFLKEKLWKQGDTLVQPELAQTLKRIRDHGAKDFYEGETAEWIVKEMRKGNGIISLEDLKNYRTIERDIIEFKYRGYEIISMPLPSSGGILLEQMLKMIEPYPIKKMKPNSVESVQLMVEIERRAFADRAQFLGDPDFVKVPVKKLISEKYLKDRMKDYIPGKAGNSKEIQAGKIYESEETTHLSIIDKEGNAVSVTTTLNGSFGSRIVVEGAGFLLNNEMDDFSIKPDVPNLYGATGNKNNSVQPGKRMLSSMTPTIVLKNNKPIYVVGTPGGTSIPTSVFQTIINLLDYHMRSDEAVNNPKFHHQWLPDEIYVEKNFNAEVIDSLKKIGYKVTQRGSIGRTELIEINKKNMIGVGDYRGNDAAEGY